MVFLQITGVQAPRLLGEQALKEWRSGQQLLVEVIQKNDDNQGTIRVDGQTLSALLETSAQAGDKFWVRVGQVEEGFLLFLRNPQAADANSVSAAAGSPEFQAAMERGVPLQPEVVALVQDFPLTDAPRLLTNLSGVFNPEFMTELKKTFPEWSTLSGEKGAEQIIECLRKLGIDYEQRLGQLAKLDPQMKETEKEALRTTLKSAVLLGLNRQSTAGEETGEEYVSLTQVLRDITGQQLWLKTGALDNAYLLFNLPLKNREEYFPAKVGIEGSRKGLKLDDKHCRIGLSLETENLGLVGVDAFFNQDTLTLRILSQDPAGLQEIVPDVLSETQAKFAKLGFSLGNIATGDIDKNPEFRDFLRGQKRSGVDLRG